MKLKGKEIKPSEDESEKEMNANEMAGKRNYGRKIKENHKDKNENTKT